MSHEFSRRGLLAGVLAVPAAPRTRRIVFIADRPSHGFGQHEANAGCLLLARCLRAVPGIETAVSRNGWPSDAGVLAGAASVVLFTNGGPGHPAAPHLDELEPLMRAGVGLAALHWGVGVEKGRPADSFLAWLGGYYETYWSVNPFWTACFASLPAHPVTRGVKPFALYDEWYYHMRFRPGMEGVTPLLTAVPPDSTRNGPDGPHSGNPAVRARKGMPEHVAWAFERPSGGRGFGFTGGHYHWAWGVDGFRQVVLNGICWTAGIEIPAGGISAPAPGFPELLENQDKPVPADFTREQAEAAIRPR